MANVLLFSFIIKDDFFKSKFFLIQFIILGLLLRYNLKLVHSFVIEFYNLVPNNCHSQILYQNNWSSIISHIMMSL